MSVASLNRETAFQARSLVSYCALPSVPPTSSADLTCRAPVPLSAAVFRPVLQLQLPGVRSP